MTTTIDTNGRATGQTTATRVLDLKPGDVIEANWEELAEVRLVEPIAGTHAALLVFVGGHSESARVDGQYSVVDPERAEKWRTYQREILRRQRLATELEALAKQIRNGELPLPGILGLEVTAHIDDAAAVEHAAKTLDVEIERRGEHTLAAERHLLDRDLHVQFRAYLPEEDA